MFGGASVQVDVEHGSLHGRTGAFTNPLAELLQAVGDAHNSAEFVESRRSQRVSAIKKESMAIEEALSSPKVFRARRQAEARGRQSVAQKQYLHSKYGIHDHNDGIEFPFEPIDVHRSGEDGPKNAMAGSAFPSSAPSYIPHVSSLLHSISATAPLISTPFMSALSNAFAYSSPSPLQGLIPAQVVQASSAATASSPSAPSLQNLILLGDLHSTVAHLSYHPPTPLAYLSPTSLGTSTSTSSSSPSFSAFTAVLSPNKFAFSDRTLSSSTFSPSSAAPLSSTPPRSDGKRSASQRASAATHRLSESLRPSSPSSSASDDCADSSHYPSSTPTSPHSDEDSMSTVRGGDVSTESSGSTSPLSLEQCGSPALLPGCGMYADYIHDLKGVCSQCSASGRLKSKKKPLVDSLLLLAFFNDGIKKTSNGFGYVIEDSNLARELMNIVSSHIRPPSRGTNNSYDNWKRAMGKTFRKSGTFFTPKDEDTAKYARHVEEHLTRIYERKKGSSPSASQ